MWCTAAQRHELVDPLLQPHELFQRRGSVFSKRTGGVEVQVAHRLPRLATSHDPLDGFSVLLFCLLELGQLVGAHALKLSLVEQADVAYFLLYLRDQAANGVGHMVGGSRHTCHGRNGHGLRLGTRANSGSLRALWRLSSIVQISREFGRHLK